MLATLPAVPDIFAPRIFGLAFGPNAAATATLRELVDRTGGIFWPVSTLNLLSAYAQISYEM